MFFRTIANRSRTRPKTVYCSKRISDAIDYNDLFAVAVKSITLFILHCAQYSVVVYAKETNSIICSVVSYASGIFKLQRKRIKTERTCRFL